MNWLAHVFLSEPTIEFRLGNLLADLVRGADRAGLPADFVRGAQCHKSIDAFTDGHAIVRHSRSRISARYRRFSGVLIDIYYDHILARRWLEYTSEPLSTFTESFYAGIRAHPLPLPEPAQATLDRIVRHDLLGQYRHLEGVEHSLRRVSTYIAKRWRRDYALEASMQELIAQQDALTDDFSRFFPELQRHVEGLDLGSDQIKS